MIGPTRVLRASWSSTLRLPKSNFPPRPSPVANKGYLSRCTEEFYAWQQSKERSLHDTFAQDSIETSTGVGKDVRSQQSNTLQLGFTLHDGPPYANGPLHIGHALNKITKDIICRFQVSQGKKVSYIPGWDCHGLPIEIKALQAQKKDAGAQVDPVAVRTAARELATRTIEEQKQGFKEWAIMGDWHNAYQTMDAEFEIRQLGVFKSMFEKGLIYRQNKPVYWSPSSKTALAEAELEYDAKHESLAAFVRFPVQLSDEIKNGALNGVFNEVNVVIWTTTPWTLPANKAIAVHNEILYDLVTDVEGNGELSLIATSRVAEYANILGRKLAVVRSMLKGSDLAGQLQYVNPFQKTNGFQQVIHADFVTCSSGTGLVHMAPGHGMDDYHICSALGIPAFAPVDDAGAFTKDAFPEQPDLLEGLHVADQAKTGSNAVCGFLDQQDLLRGKQKYFHNYPIDWRTKQPIIVRATEQWFADVEGIKNASLKALQSVTFLPESGYARLESFIKGRSQWCISRQRAWGVPIPALYRVEGETLTAVMDTQTVEHIIEVIKQRGIDAWWTDAPDDLAWKPPYLVGNYVRGKDTMDVWFDSGTSWTLLPPQEGRPMADVYFEGTDQHRGWFQSALLTHIASQSYSTEAKAPYATLITHGFVLDAEGRKMSKSLGNVISPAQIMSGELLPPVKQKKQKGKSGQEKKNDLSKPTHDVMGSDALRLWAASSDYTCDVTIGPSVLYSTTQALHKYRVTFKWLLGIFSLPTCPPPFLRFDLLFTNPPSPNTLPNLADRLALHRLAQINREIYEHYQKYEFFKGISVLNKYISTDLSAFYFETLKDRIYTGTHEDCQSLLPVLGTIFYMLLQILSPICPLLVEEVWQHVPQGLREASTHPARAPWRPEPTARDELSSKLSTMQQNMTLISEAIQLAQEDLRTSKHIGSGLESTVQVYLAHAPDAQDLLSDFQRCMAPLPLTRHDLQHQLAALLVVSKLELYIAAHTDDCIDSHPHHARVGPGARVAAKTPFPLAPRPRAMDIGPAATLAKIEFPIRGKGATPMAWLYVRRAGEHKCPRCWRYVCVEEGELCGRCEGVVGGCKSPQCKSL